MAKRNRFVSQAALEALVRFGPELSGLKELQRQAEGNYTGAVRTARATSQGIVNAVDRAAPRIGRIYDDAGLTAASVAQTLIGRDLAGLSGVADSIKAGGSLEAAGMAGRLNEAKAAGLADMAQRKVQARSGEQFAVQNAQRQFVDDLAKVMGRKQDLRRERGAFEAATAGDLREKQRDRSQRERNSLRTAGIDPDTGRPIPGGKLDKSDKPKGPAASFKAKYGISLNTPGQHGTARDRVDERVTDARAFKVAGMPRREAAAALVHGIPDQPVLDRTGKQKVEKAGDGSFVKAKQPGVKEWGNSLWTSIALDVAYDGHVSRKNAAELHRRGYSVRQLGLKGAPSGSRSRSPRPPLGKGPGGRQVRPG